MLPRHTLAWIELNAGRRLLERAEPEERAELGSWIGNDWPLCVRRPDVGEALFESTVALGLPLPPQLGKRRLRFAVDRADVAHTAEPLPLRAVVARAPARFRAFLDTLDERARDRGVRLQVYGSFAWQALTSWRYVTPQSDLDLLVTPADAGGLDAAVALLTRAASAAPLRIDGEIVFPGGEAVSWREWREPGRDDRVMVKRLDGVAMTPRGALRARLAGGVPA
jgi:phosphoribosyl-dephospho-CoA transferase